MYAYPFPTPPHLFITCTLTLTPSTHWQVGQQHPRDKRRQLGVHEHVRHRTRVQRDSLLCRDRRVYGAEAEVSAGL